MKEYIVKSFEEECGSDFWRVFVPEDIDIDVVMEKFKMASKYAAYFDEEDNRDDFDKHFDMMLDYKEENNGIDAFNYYITEVCGWKIEPLMVDFEYEW